MIDLINVKINRIYYVVLNYVKPRIVNMCLKVLMAARKKVVQDDDYVSLR